MYVCMCLRERVKSCTEQQVGLLSPEGMAQLSVSRWPTPTEALPKLLFQTAPNEITNFPLAHSTAVSDVFCVTPFGLESATGICRREDKRLKTREHNKCSVFATTFVKHPSRGQMPRPAVAKSKCPRCLWTGAICH
mmetsp:Transcript_21120/g.56284  ORF Transcript_21120/g.56284 Transcript_21120/m.56284 type:complete len:136 (-) Transcript_21120:1507-1914(-)